MSRFSSCRDGVRILGSGGSGLERSDVYYREKILKRSDI
jgi:hypothetical protein